MSHLNTFVPDVPFLYPLRRSENFKVFYFPGINKCNMGTNKLIFLNVNSHAGSPEKDYPKKPFNMNPLSSSKPRKLLKMPSSIEIF